MAVAVAVVPDDDLGRVAAPGQQLGPGKGVLVAFDALTLVQVDRGVK
jgi:hypothetical protein